MLEICVYAPGHVEALAKALEPDNKVLPSNLKLQVVETSEDSLKILIESDDIGTIISTANDIFACLRPSLKVLSKG
ncbi:MAG: KEOPS complex subunit Pcc1 [Candidatus Nezhaarchaeales archaeon]